MNLYQNAWHAENQVTYQLPKMWNVRIAGDQPLPALTSEEIRTGVENPAAGPGLGEIAKGKQTAIILVDDLSRPTPAGQLIHPILSVLRSAGLKHDQIRILIATGSHAPPDETAIQKKLGSDFPNDIEVLVHDCHAGCRLIGQTPSGTPVWINEYVLSSDVRIGISSLYPHPAAGFSGGGKILALGASGYETIRTMHDQRQGPAARSGDTAHTFRHEINTISEMAGLDFSVNVLLNQAKKIHAVFAGDRVRAFEKAAAYARTHYSVKVDRDADVVIVDMFPFDADFQFAFDRGLWPFECTKRESFKILLASCPEGIGGHELFPLKNPFMTRLKRRLKHLSIQELLSLPARINAIKKMMLRRSLDPVVVSRFLAEDALQQALPKARLAASLEEALNNLPKHLKGRELTCTVYRCAPLMLPKAEI